MFQGSLAEEDANRLYDVLNQLTEHKEDSQQRNWAIHEDFLVIKELLENLMSIMVVVHLIYQWLLGTHRFATTFMLLKGN